MRNLRIAAAIAFIALSLGGCAGLGDMLGMLSTIATLNVKNPVSGTTIASVESGYGIALAASVAYADRYREGHRCTKTSLESATNLCSRRSIVEKLQAADLKAQDAIADAKAFIARNPTLNAGAAIDAAQTAVAAFRRLTAS
jgi:hypothetical protein